MTQQRTRCRWHSSTPTTNTADYHNPKSKVIICFNSSHSNFWENDLIVLSKELFHCLLLGFFCPIRFFLLIFSFNDSFIALAFFLFLYFSVYLLLLSSVVYVLGFLFVWLFIYMPFSRFLYSKTYGVLMQKLNILFA